MTGQNSHDDDNMGSASPLLDLGHHGSARAQHAAVPAYAVAGPGSGSGSGSSVGGASASSRSPAAPGSKEDRKFDNEGEEVAPPLLAGKRKRGDRGADLGDEGKREKLPASCAGGAGADQAKDAAADRDRKRRRTDKADAETKGARNARVGQARAEARLAPLHDLVDSLKESESDGSHAELLKQQMAPMNALASQMGEYLKFKVAKEQAEMRRAQASADLEELRVQHMRLANAAAARAAQADT